MTVVYVLVWLVIIAVPVAFVVWVCRNWGDYDANAPIDPTLSLEDQWDAATKRELFGRRNEPWVGGYNQQFALASIANSYEAQIAQRDAQLAADARNAALVAAIDRQGLQHQLDQELAEVAQLSEEAAEAVGTLRESL